MKIKTSELTGAALDWAVYEAEKQAGRTDVYMRWFGDGRRDAPWCNGPFKPSTDWSQGGPIIERERISVVPLYQDWEATFDIDEGDAMVEVQTGPTSLIAAMRCYVASELGDEVEVPDELA